jgi:general secretion pathway protein H
MDKSFLVLFFKKELLSFPGLPLTCVLRHPQAVVPPMRGREHGFTLIEILVVLAILGAVIGIFVAHGPVRSQGLQTRAAAGLLAQTLRAARAQAIERAQVVRVAIDPAQHSFATDAGPVHQVDRATGMEILPPILKGPRGTSLIRFAPDGSASGGGVLLGNGKRQLRVEVEWLTGRVRVSDAH